MTLQNRSYLDNVQSVSRALHNVYLFKRLHPVGWRASRSLLDVSLGLVVDRLLFMIVAMQLLTKMGEERSASTTLSEYLFIFRYSSHGVFPGLRKDYEYISSHCRSNFPSWTGRRYLYINTVPIRRNFRNALELPTSTYRR